MNSVSEFLVFDLPGWPGYGSDNDNVFYSRWRACGRGKGGGSGSTTYLSATWRRLRPRPDKDGYLCLAFRRAGGKRKTVRIHRLVLERLVGPCPAGCEARHINGNPQDNRIDNLAWSTHKENCADRVLHGTVNRGERNGLSKLTAEQAKDIRRRVGGGETKQAVADSCGVAWTTIHDVVMRHTWDWLA